MITVDILSPVGGLHGGIENVIKTWVKFIDHDKFDLRVIHLTPGIAYLEGYEKAYQYVGPGDLQGDDILSYYLLAYKSFIEENGAPHICVATNYPNMSLVARETRNYTNTNFRIISWAHNNIKIYAENGRGGIEHLLCADAHLVLSKTTSNYISQYDSSAITYIVGNPVNIQDFVEKDSFTHSIAYVGRLDIIKRVDILLEAIYRAKSNWNLKVIGSDGQEEELKKISSYLKLDNQVEFLGWKNDPWNNVKDADLFILTSEYEGYALVCAEALSTGMTVISTPVDGVVDYIKPGINGYFFPINDAIALAQILDCLDAGTLPVCDRRTCRESIIDQSEENYMAMIMDILETEFKKLS